MKRSTSSPILLAGFFFIVLFFVTFAQYGNSHSLQQIDYPSSAINYPENPIISSLNVENGVIDSNGHKILYWVQVSDIHINTHKELERNDKFDDFCGYINNTVKPAFVVSTGDNVDAVEAHSYPVYYQNETEYIVYNETLDKYDFDRDFWFSVLGNHDVYNTALNRPLWYKYIRNETQYAVDINTTFGKYRFVMADTTHEVGMELLTGVFGEMKTDKLNHLESLLPTDSDNINHTVFSGHHPLNEILGEKTDTGKDLGDLIAESESTLYMCGHIHSNDLYANHGDLVEIQCPSFKVKYNYRVCVFDNDIFSFSDLDFEENPGVVITNPVDARFYTTNMPLERMESQNEIRALVFNTSEVISAYAEIDNVKIGNLTDQGNNLMTVPWSDIADYKTGMHKIKVVITCADGKTTVQELEFSLSDFTPIPLPLSTTYVIRIPIAGLLMTIIIILMIFSLERVLLPKIFYKLNYGKLKDVTIEEINKADMNFVKKYFLKKWILTARTVPGNIGILLLILPLFVLFGPITIGMFSNQDIGFMWLLFSRITILGNYAVSLWPIIMAAVFMICCEIIRKYTLRGYRRKIGIVARLPLIFYILGIGVVIGLTFIFWNPISLLINPSLYIFTIIPIYLIIKTEKLQIQKRKIRKSGD
jgi:hypothetical protein